MNQVRTGELLAGGGAVALLIVMFVEWYSRGGQGLTAWQAFGVVDLLLAAVLLLALGLLAVQVVGRGPALPVALGVIAAVLAAVAVLAVAYRIVNQPGPNDATDVRAGAWLGLLAASATFYGVWRSISDERPRPADPPAPEPERRPTPARS
jgi:hypothetical protein